MDAFAREPCRETPSAPLPRCYEQRRDRRARRVVFGLTGLLGAAWAVVIASRYVDDLPH